MINQHGQALESYNARHLRLRDIASTFVSSQFFEILSAPRHSLILGPRGSGKTTLLKMLLQPALEYWDAPDAANFRSRIDFTGIFVPTDITWVNQLVSFKDRLKDESVERVFVTAVFSTHICRAFVTAVRERTEVLEDRPFAFRRKNLSSLQCERIARHLIHTWKLGDIFPSLAAIYQQLGANLLGIDQLATTESFLGPEGRQQRLSMDERLKMSFPAALQPAIDIANEELGEPDGKWAILFDELELAPVWIQDGILPLLRSTDERLLFKVALSPFVFTDALRSITSPTASNDYDPVQLWFQDKDNRHLAGFCRKIWCGTLRAKGLNPVDPDVALGRSRFDVGRYIWKSAKTAYHPAAPIAKEFRELASKDRSFATYIETNGLKPEKWPEMNGIQRAKSIRKIQHTVIARNYFRGLGRQRSRKSKDLYCGASALFSISEGNPRVLKAIIGSLLTWVSDLEGSIPRHIQAEAMMDAANRFEALLAISPVPGAEVPIAVGTPSLVEIVESVAKYFHDVAIEDSFQEEPPGSFTVDRALSPSVLEVLQSGLNMGGVILVADGAERVRGELRGARLRLSYLMTMKYDGLIRLGRPINLSTILSKSNASRGVARHKPGQLALLPDSEQAYAGEED